jgi:hypothetical protein
MNGSKKRKLTLAVVVEGGQGHQGFCQDMPREEGQCGMPERDPGTQALFRIKNSFPLSAIFLS